MPDVSTYLRFLPPVLWEEEAAPPDFSLGATLRLFEKILSGIEDGVPVTHDLAGGGSHAHRGIEQVIAQLQRLYGPWTCPDPFLDWLASWVALEFDPLWDPYQRRKLLSQMVQIYRRRGLKEGLDTFLDIHTVATKRPRITVDDCSKILFCRPLPSRFASIYTIVSQLPIVAPTCIAQAPDGSFIAGDEGTPATYSSPRSPAFWRLPSPGEYAYGGTPPVPQPLPLSPLVQPTGVAVTGAPANYQVFALDHPVLAGNALWRMPSTAGFAPVVLATKASLGLGWPVGMVATAAANLLILDRGVSIGDPDAPTPAVPRIIEVQNAVTGPPVTVVPHALTGIVEPFAIAILADGRIVVADAAQQDGTSPADLFVVDPAAGWAATSLLSAMPAGTNPLVAPSAVVQLDATTLLVADVGLRPYRNGLASLYEKLIAEPSTLYRVDLSTAPPTVTRAAEQKQLVYPSGMVRDGATVYISDRGEYSDEEEAGPFTRAWRAERNEFGVIVYFSTQRPTTQTERRQIVGNVAAIVEQEKPAHSRWTLTYTV